jgi:hypothetical protein
MPVSSPGPAPPAAVPAGPVARTTRDLGVLAVVVVVLAAIVKVGSGVEYAVPVSLGNTPITNTDEVIADAEEVFGQHVDAQATRVAVDAGCYFYRPFGSTQGAVPADMFPAGLLPGGEDAEAIDLLLCGPVEMSGQAMDTVPGMAPQPWLTGVVYYYEDDGPAPAYRGEFQTMLQSSLSVLTAATGGVQAEALVRANGHHPDGGDLSDPEWRDVTPTGETPPGGIGLPGGGGGGGGDGGIELPPGVTLPPGMSLPELPELPEMPGGTGG